ncbi:MAG TPA: serine/threonine-protein kinase, partial [Chthoniobacterales bacterium]
HVIHRDLKPSNILVNRDGEPKLLDFGIAKLLGPGQESLELTAAGEERLTPHCASPEQTDGRRVTEASDVYALGALLYEMLSGQKPHKFSSAHPRREEIVRVIREEDPPLPSVAAGDVEAARRLRGDLDAIVQFAMRKEPEMRYRTVTAFAADVRRHLAHEPVLARRGTAGYRAKSLLARNRRRLRLAATITGLVALGAVLFAFWSREARKPLEAGAVPDKSIAVLPFEQFSHTEERSYFADGVQDNILTDLGKVSDLKVISRSGVAAYRGKQRDVKQIGRELGVANVLEGSVQISGDRVRINAQLIDTRSAAQVWAEHYDRELKDLFALQSELAQTIVGQLKATLSSGEKVAIWKKPTEDLQAYDLYLRARASIGGTISPAEGRAIWSGGIDLVTQALARDPKFTRAYCLLTELHLRMYRFGADRTPPRLAAAKEAAETALRLEPDLEESRLAMARYFYDGFFDYRRTEAELEKMAAASTAHTVEFYTLASLVERRLGKWDATVRNGERAIELDPRNLELAVNLAQTLTGLRRLEHAQRVIDAAMARADGAAPRRLWLCKTEVEMTRGDVAAARAVLDSAPQNDAMDLHTAQMMNAFYARDFARVAAL